MPTQQYFTRRISIIPPKNQFQKAIHAESRAWEQWLVDSATDFQAFVKARVEHLHKNYPRCGAMPVHKPYVIHDGIFRFDIGQFISLDLHPVQGRWDKRGKFQLYLPMECEPPKPLRRLTEMTYDEFHEYIAGKTRCTPSYMDQKIRTDFVSMAGFFYTLGYIGEFGSYRRLKEAGFDVEFTLGWEGATIS